jgi:hypothetical protein
VSRPGGGASLLEVEYKAARKVGESCTEGSTSEQSVAPANPICLAAQCTARRSYPLRPVVHGVERLWKGKIRQNGAVWETPTTEEDAFASTFAHVQHVNGFSIHHAKLD